MDNSPTTNGHGRFETSVSDANTIIGQHDGASPISSPQSSSFTQPTGTTGSMVIPPDHPFRTLVLCFDGTGDQFDSDNSNIVQFFSMLPKADRSKQMVYYQAGIGTYTSPTVATPFMSKISKFVDEAIGRRRSIEPNGTLTGCPAWNIDAHVMGGYEFLMQNYTANDRICIFGFSRGAYTARRWIILAGMLHKVGLLPADNMQQVPFAYKMYTRADEVGWAQSNSFKKAFSIDVDIEFIGVWDTVNSVGLIPKRLPFTTSNTIVRTFRHAVSLDERRAKFKPNLWNRPNAKEQSLSISDQKVHDHSNRPRPPSKKMSQHLMEHKYARDPNKPTDIDEVWFAGCHCDVGGGSVANDTAHTLAQIPLRWMVRECFKTNSGIMFDCEGLRSIGMDPASLYPIVAPRPPHLSVGNLRLRPIPSKSQTGAQKEQALQNYATSEGTSATVPRKTEEEMELHDALSPVYDQLSLAWFWWLLEFLPIKQRYQKGDTNWVSYLGWNMGRGRFIPKQKSNGVRVHRSVKMRLEAQTEEGGKYKPKAAFDLERTTWVD
ncbi:hypothetical protein C8J57DRAFT_1243788 [Mycena rebaudengoi]|nr:hypothetical protein C8J57DRAFT_1243788 [Mycena rebaudengoi]